MTKILGISGRKQSGKNSTFNYLIGMEMARMGIIRGQWRYTESGLLQITDMFGDIDFAGVFDPGNRNPHVRRLLAEHTDFIIKAYSFADSLKEMCIKLFKLKESSCYGTNEEKDAKTHLKWQDMPGIYANKVMYDKTVEANPEISDVLTFHRFGPMTGREVMEYVGTNIGRRIYDPIWIESTIDKIVEDKSELAVITDVRFPNEVEAIHKAGGKVIRLARNPFPDSTHPAEVSLDRANFDWAKFDVVIDNSVMTLDEKAITVQKVLESWGYMDKMELGS